jgi:hypothetical protein
MQNVCPGGNASFDHSKKSTVLTFLVVVCSMFPRSDFLSLVHAHPVQPRSFICLDEEWSQSSNFSDRHAAALLSPFCVCRSHQEKAHLKLSLSIISPLQLELALCWSTAHPLSSLACRIHHFCTGWIEMESVNDVEGRDASDKRALLAIATPWLAIATTGVAIASDSIEKRARISKEHAEFEFGGEPC